eukprot:CAMPEP_0182920296 /NCGR_PEP_ID=MMETSP0105_2-20130417/3356_1 /TAXON_ID=81532 ORGANISM="Acanthoeca-like sp., Strain 10tr" /NCGR_SAMPLE_ID=MMETSP0105_2 /ASSEMBLY_ACC=CAM_ASM_000205 /LENGTH=55 /DNA_ID=CAMNT_0025057667 /DNA_START=458 /DNA_END=622 /DNA_ORIENTATION=-
MTAMIHKMSASTATARNITHWGATCRPLFSSLSRYRSSAVWRAFRLPSPSSLFGE